MTLGPDDLLPKRLKLALVYVHNAVYMGIILLNALWGSTNNWGNLPWLHSLEPLMALNRKPGLLKYDGRGRRLHCVPHVSSIVLTLQSQSRQTDQVTLSLHWSLAATPTLSPIACVCMCVWVYGCCLDGYLCLLSMQHAVLCVCVRVRSLSIVRNTYRPPLLDLKSQPHGSLVDQFNAFDHTHAIRKCCLL